mmetsp:Transcript_57919/g.188331  ORF Transcript_57919/g.188331 Transcript_57919/m.188331 type:complete len:211 (+) Transcript_57919:281-913(+)
MRRLRCNLHGRGLCADECVLFRLEALREVKLLRLHSLHSSLPQVCQLGLHVAVLQSDLLAPQLVRQSVVIICDRPLPLPLKLLPQIALRASGHCLALRSGQATPHLVLRPLDGLRQLIVFDLHRLALSALQQCRLDDALGPSGYQVCAKRWLHICRADRRTSSAAALRLPWRGLPGCQLRRRAPSAGNLRWPCCWAVLPELSKRGALHGG